MLCCWLPDFSVLWHHWFWLADWASLLFSEPLLDTIAMIRVVACQLLELVTRSVFNKADWAFLSIIFLGSWLVEFGLWYLVEFFFWKSFGHLAHFLLEFQQLFICHVIRINWFGIIQINRSVLLGRMMDVTLLQMHESQLVHQIIFGFITESQLQRSQIFIMTAMVTLCFFIGMASRIWWWLWLILGFFQFLFE